MPRKAPELDLDFNIYVDPSCLSEPMDGETPATVPPSADEVHETVVPDTPEELVTADATVDADQTAQDATGGAAEQQEPEPPAPEGDIAPLQSEGPAIEEAEQPEVEATEQEPVAEQPETSTEEKLLEEPPAPEDEQPAQPPAADESASSASTEDAPVTPDASPEADSAPEPEQADEPVAEDSAADVDTEPSSGPEPADEPFPEAAAEEEAVAESTVPQDQKDGDVEPQSAEEPVIMDFDRQEEETEATAENAPASDGPVEEDTSAPEVPAEEKPSPESQDILAGNADVETSPRVESDGEEERGPQRNFTDRKTSLRTEALIQAAARAVVAKIEKRKSGDLPDHDDDFDESLITGDSQDTYVPGTDVQDSVGHGSRPLSRQSSESHAVRHIPSRSTSSDEAGDSSSHNGRDDDVFSVRSTRSSLCSLDNDNFHAKTPQAKESLSRRDSYSSTLHHHSSPSPARTVSNFSTISGLSQYDNDYYDSDLSPKHTFIPYDATIKPTRQTTRRMPFRTPSEIRAMQMSSPTPSVFSGSSPVRRSPGSGGGRESSGKRSSLSRLGSPAAAAAAQYSPKGRSTPPRFKSAPPQEAPLVLLHVTLLPLRWAWAGVLESLDSLAVGGKAAGVAAGEEGGCSSTSPEAGAGLPSSAAAAAAAALRAFEPSDQLKSLRDAWRELQDRVGDTVLERGILLPHPQSDYEVLEERLLEALELPLRRRARILECGHYVGPANVDPDESSDEEGYDDEEKEDEKRKKRHWCSTCREEIRYEDLGPGKVFRVKVYASNGLMKAGAWEACWKEMERVDVELEPIVDVAVQNELERLAVLQMELDEQRRRELEMMERTPDPEPEAELKRESTFGQDPGSPSRQQTEHPTSEADLSHMDAQRAMMSSPAPSPGMQLARRTSTPQPSASTTLVRADTPTTYPIDTSEERRLRDEERMREIYGDNPPAPPPAPAPASAPAAAPARLPAPPAPAEQAQHQQQQHQHAHYQQLQHAHSHALTAAAPPPSMPLLTDAPYRHHPQHDPYHTNPLQQQPDDPYDQRGRRQGQQQRPPARPIVLDENSGFVELLMEAFKVLLRDPKNVAIIVLCVFLVVLMKRPGGAPQQLSPAPLPPSPPPQQQQQQQQPPVVQVVPPSLGPAGGYRMDEGHGHGRDDAHAASKGVVTPPSVNAPVMEYVEEVLASMAAPEVDDGLGPVGAAAEPAVVIKQAEDVSAVEEPEAEPVEAGAAQVEEDSAAAEQVAGVEATKAEEGGKVVAPALSLSLPADVCPPRGLEYPITLVGEVPEIGEAESEDDQSSAAPQTPSPPESPADQEAVLEQSAALEPENPEESNASFEAAAAEAEGKPEQDGPAGRCDVDADFEDDDDDEEEEEEEEDSANPDTDDAGEDAAVPAAATTTATSSSTRSASTSPAFLPGPFVTERKTVRVFETVTETVRVSVVTQTETVSTVVTAIPQTVEETVYETETVRITVSVPVEEQKHQQKHQQQQQQKQKKKVQASKGCRRTGWF
ncbi:hypothetical protein MYCTH_2312896 [Thermothelomyces thermophilus ATCC 42464]|uniref:Pathway-specific nitrogen regulator n=1 Tax=Thermothelomyces thermophilus (strain ATCC 42464 / BCRC 31852 / DSM 1799) TaxID=573729 RepID=G2QND9_THET4|nr:uncharacterized protein MYCTH_2312896 [Thermothelomyces thermophilus ATCC 42464]AEO62012.1 hypothetical protein MYCTH_2312896 [Thermothelomyces thermophilus ATCC 42464]